MPTTNNKPSRQVLYQRRHLAAGLCVYCNRKLHTKTLCLKHAKEQRDRYRLGQEALTKLRKSKS